jgi:hypothetical protein
MKTTRTIATVLLAAFLVLGPTLAFAAGETVTVTTDASSYTGTTPIHVSGTVTPAPTVSNTNVVITTKGPNGVVDTNSINVAQTTGTFAYTIAPGSAIWITGQYTVNATYGGPGGTGSQTTTFQYQANGGVGNQTTVTVTSTVTSVSTTTTTTTIASATITSTIVNPDNATLGKIETSLGVLTTAVNGMTSTLNTISSGISSIQSTLGSVSNGISTVSGIGAQLTTLNNGVSNDQTYVLVVAALAAITLVLELAILVRKLS